MWIKVDDRFPEHQKVLRAAAHLGSNGVGRVLAVWLEAICYCGRNLTDGFVPDIIARAMKADRKPLDVLHVMSMDDVRLMHRIDNGFRFHDYQDYQPSAEEIKRKRKKDLARKKGLLNGADSERSSHGIQNDSARNRSGFPSARARAIPTRPGTQGEEQAASRPRLAFSRPAEPPNVRVLTRLAHVVLDRMAVEGLPLVESSELTYRLKDAAARHRLSYDGMSIGKAERSALFQRARRRA